MYQEQPTEWLLDCLRTGATDEKAARLGRLSGSDWSQVLDVAMRQTVAPLLYDRLKPLSSNGQVPSAVLLRLRDTYLVNAARNMKIYHDLGQVLAALRTENIPVIVLKGAHLAELVYGNIALRTMGDLDLLVKKDALARAAAKLRELGYAWEDRQGIEAFYASMHHLPPFVRPGAALIEIHRTILDPLLGLNIENDGLWERSRAVVVAGVETRVLSPEDLLLHLCVHATYHSYSVHGLRPFCDIAQTLQHHLADMDWGQVQLRAQQWGAKKGVHLTLLLLRGLLGAPVPEQVLASLRPNDFDDKWEAFACKQIHSMGDVGAKEREVSWERDCGSLKMARLLGPSPLLSKMGILPRALFPSPRVMRLKYRVPLRSPRLYFCYLLRLCSLVRQYLPIAWRFVRRGRKRTLHDVREIWPQAELPEFYDWVRK
jgi:hypothetical protein